VVYVGSAKGPDWDQLLDQILVGPVPIGANRFILHVDSPDASKIPNDDLLGVTLLLISCLYKNQEFVRVGFFVNNEYEDPELQQNPSASPDFAKIARNVLFSKPRVTRFPIEWDSVEPTESMQTLEMVPVAGNELVLLAPPAENDMVPMAV